MPPAAGDTPIDRERIERLKRDDKRFVWHPFTQMKDWLDDDPLVIERAEGVELIDIEGRRYLDGVSSLWTNVHGHQVPEIDRAVSTQLGKVAHSTLLGLGSAPAIDLARALVAVTPSSVARVFYSDSGSSAVEVALKMAFQFWRQQGAPRGAKTGFACLGDAYHGDTIGSVSVGGIDLFHAIYRPLLFETVRIPAPFCYRCPLGERRADCDMECAGEAERLIDRHRDQLAAVVMEPLVQGAAGMIVHPEGFLSRVAAACRHNEVLLILDEVATGFGRTGKLFACEHEGVEPDLIALAKGLSGGYLPLAATIASDRIFEGFLGSFESRRTLFHGHTYTGNPLACAAALASLELFEQHCVLEHVALLAHDLGCRLDTLAGRPHVGEVRAKGLMAGVELVKDVDTGEPFDAALRVGHRVILEARKRGAILRPLGDVIVIMPALAIGRNQLDRLLDIVEESINAVVETL
ncbi:MAG: adenosylmethionine--8-amino-7-oxononanoate transaminase [Gemmatimonadetes bacterium]|nr:adenosylmethionine--8-amino-7-oxononanoate transaminase [Gemmatimonadota bacterium]